MNPSAHEFIPYCNFASKGAPQILGQCQLFKRESHPMQMESCFTFNNDTGNDLKVPDPKMGTYEGLNFMINFNHLGTERQKSQPAKMILHESGTYPDVQHIKSKYVLLDPGQVINIKLLPKVTEVTSDFESMSFEYRQCNIDKNYSGEINCILDKKLESARKFCGCLPWFVQNASNLEPVCDAFGTKCFEETMMKEMNIKDCPSACSLTKYSTSLANQKSLTSIQSNLKDFGLENYFKQENLKSLFIDLQELDFDYYSKNLKKVSLIHLNFEDFQAEVLTNDAKLTPVNMIGTLGGLLGVFLGFSFLGILDSFIECTHGLIQKYVSGGKPLSPKVRPAKCESDTTIIQS